MATAIFFRITPPRGQNAREWAKRMWDTFGFDFDNERCTTTVLAWSLESDDELKKALDADGIEYETFEEDDNHLFGLNQ